MRSICLSCFYLFLIFIESQSQEFNPQFFCFEDAFLKEHTNDPVFQTKLLKDLGFDGMELLGTERIEAKLAALDEQHLRLFMVYMPFNLEDCEQSKTSLEEAIRKVAGRGVTLWLYVLSNTLKPSDPAGDAILVPILQDLADFAMEYGVNLALYPHTNFWLEKVGDSVRLTAKINRRNVGAVFNLCHYLRVDERDDLKPNLVKALPWLAAVSINGADDGETNKMDWDRLIQPLGKGSFDVLQVLKILRDNHYQGPVGLQCYNITGKPEEFLKISMESWKKYKNDLNP